MAFKVQVNLCVVLLSALLQVFRLCATDDEEYKVQSTKNISLLELTVCHHQAYLPCDVKSKNATTIPRSNIVGTNLFLYNNVHLKSLLP